MVPQGWKAWALAIACFALVLAATFHEALAGKAELSPNGLLYYEDRLYLAPAPLPAMPMRWDLTPEHIYGPWDRWAFSTMRAGHLPTWQAGNGLGSPLMVNGEATCFNPLKWLCFGPAGVTSSSLSWYHVLRLFCSGLGVMALAASLDLGPLGALIAAAAFCLSGTALYRIGFMDTAATVLPWLVWAGVKLGQERSGKRAAWLALLVGLVVQIDHPEGALVAAMAAGIVALVLGRSWRSLALVSAAAVVGAGLASVVVVPFLAFTRACTSYLDFPHGYMMNLATANWPPARDLASILASVLAPDAMMEPYRYNTWVGSVVAALAILGLRERLAARVAGTLALVFGILFLVLPPSSPARYFPPFLADLYARVPLFTAKSYYAMPLLALALALLAGAGLKQLQDRRLAVASAVLAAAVLAFWLLAPANTPIFYFAPATAAHLGRSALFLLGVGAGALLLRHHRLLAPLAAAAAVVELVLAARIIHPPLPIFDYPVVPVTRRLLDQPPPFRMTGLWNVLVPNTNLPFGIDAIDSVAAFHPRRYHRYMQAVDLKPLPVMSYAVVTLPFRPGLLDLANVRYLVVHERGDVGRALLEHLDPRYVTDGSDGRVTVLRSTTAAPRAWVAYAASFMPAGSSLDAVADRLVASHQDWRGPVLLEGAPATGPQPNGLRSTPATIVERTPSRLVIAARAAQAGWLVLSEAYFPGWRAEVDGRPVEIVPADLAFRAVALPPGDHRVTFTYEPEGLRPGAAISLASLILLVALAWL